MSSYKKDALRIPDECLCVILTYYFLLCNLPDVVGIFSASVSMLHLILPPLRLMGLIIVGVALMTEPLVEVVCPTIDDEFSVRV